MGYDILTNRVSQLKIVGVVALTIVAAGGLTVSLAALPGTASASVQVNDFSVPDAETEAEQVDDVGIDFVEGSVAWVDTPEPVEEVGITLSVEGPDGEMHDLFQVTCDHTNPVDDCGFERSTEDSVVFPGSNAVDLVEGGPWESDDFSPEPGSEVSHTIDVVLEADVMWDGGSVSESASDSTTITVTHPDDAETGDEAGNGTEEEQADPEVAIDFGTADVFFIESE